MAVCSIASLFQAFSRVIRLKEVVQVTKIVKLGPKFNIRTNDDFERVKLVANEIIKRCVAIGLGRGITQLDLLSLWEERFMFSKREMSINFTLGCEPLFRLLL